MNDKLECERKMIKLWCVCIYSHPLRPNSVPICPRRQIQAKIILKYLLSRSVKVTYTTEGYIL